MTLAQPPAASRCTSGCRIHVMPDLIGSASTDSCASLAPVAARARRTAWSGGSRVAGNHVRDPAARGETSSSQQQGPRNLVENDSNWDGPTAGPRGSVRPRRGMAGRDKLGELVPLPPGGAPTNQARRAKTGRAGRRGPAQVQAGGPGAARRPRRSGSRGQRQHTRGEAHGATSSISTRTPAQLGQEPGRPLRAVVAAGCGDEQDDGGAAGGLTADP